MKPVVAVPLWLALPLYAIYAAVWVVVVALVIALSAATVVGYAIVALIRRRNA